MINNYLLVVQNKSIIAKLPESNITFLFPLKDFTVGFPTTYSLEDIDIDNAFIFVNRILDNASFLEFKKTIKKLPSNIKGIVFDDIGILEFLNNSSSSLTKILFLNHFNCNYLSINTYLDYVDSVLVSPDLTFLETNEILKLAKKKLVTYTFGHVTIMSSRRTLITNYNKEFNKSVPLISEITNDLKQKFKIVENKYGTVIYTNEPFNGLRYRGNSNILYHFINSLFLNDEEIIKIINSTSNLESDYPYSYLALEEGIVRIKEREK